MRAINTPLIIPERIIDMAKRFLMALLFAGAAGTTGAAEWRALFNGNNLNGWRQVGGQAEYRVEDGEIVGVSVPDSPNSFLITRRNCGDFILEYEVFVDPLLHSGVQIRSQSWMVSFA